MRRILRILIEEINRSDNIFTGIEIGSIKSREGQSDLAGYMVIIARNFPFLHIDKNEI